MELHESDCDIRAGVVIYKELKVKACFLKLKCSCYVTCVIETQGGYSEFQVTGMIEWGQKSIPKKIPRASNKTQKKIPGPKIYPKKIPCRNSEPYFPERIK